MKAARVVAFVLVGLGAITSAVVFGQAPPQPERRPANSVPLTSASGGHILQELEIGVPGFQDETAQLMDQYRKAQKDEDKKEIILAELAQGDFFGEMAIIDGKQRSADASVAEDARLAVLSRENFLRFIRNNPTVALEMLSATFSRLRRTDKMLQQRVSRNVNEEQKKRMTLADRAADAIAEFGGSWKFIMAAVLFFNLLEIHRRGHRHHYRLDRIQFLCSGSRL